MFARAASFFVLALPALAAATALPRNGPTECNSGSLLCCETTQSVSSAQSAGILTLVESILIGLLGLGSLDVASTCSPLTVVGTASTNCVQQSVCCDNDSFNGVIALGCTPVNVNA